jgi:hypothetical protein
VCKSYIPPLSFPSLRQPCQRSVRLRDRRRKILAMKEVRTAQGCLVGSWQICIARDPQFNKICEIYCKARSYETRGELLQLNKEIASNATRLKFISPTRFAYIRSGSLIHRCHPTTSGRHSNAKPGAACKCDEGLKVIGGSGCSNQEYWQSEIEEPHNS